MNTTHNKNSVFATLSSINLNDKVEKKKDLTYLSWTYAWSEVKKHYPNAQYEVKFFNGLPYVYDSVLGYMVFTTVTIEDQTHMMWLPVMDGANRSMMANSYTYITKFGEKTVDAATMFDINKTIMRCLVKNIAMFGLGIYIYSGEDLPEVENIQNNSPIQKEQLTKSSKKKVETIAQLNKIVDWISEDLSRKDKLSDYYLLDAGQMQWIEGELQNRF
jgi:hypothetical protein